MSKKRLAKQLWYGSEIDHKGNPVPPAPAVDGDNLSGLIEGEVYIHNHPEKPSLFIRTTDGKVRQVTGADFDVLDQLYLSKIKDDRSKGSIASDKGFEAGRFVSGFLGGTGAWIGADGYSEMSGLTLREFLEVPELRFNRIDVVSGELWNAVAFGMVEEVDTENRICKIKLEENERCGLHVGDFCRGIFADFEDGNNWEGEDECGFMHLYGFWTSYFTPTKILENEEGLFLFEYELKPGTTQHPTQSMKFAVYGHPTDKSRQASAYATRTYKRYLNKVNTWVISPDEHIYAQYGDLSGLQIDGVNMQGYGSFQSNAYFRGVQIQLPPEQMESLKGESAYAAQLTSYVGTVKLDADGNMSGGMFEELNVIAGGKNVICRDIEQPQTFRNVTTKNCRLTTTVQAYKGTTPLYYSADVAAKGSFTLALACVGCTASVVNGAIIINSITDTKDCRINITVNCEGMAVYNLEYNVAFVQDGKIGKDGENGADAVSYRIEPNIQTISKTMTGSLEPESVKFKLQVNKGGVINYYPTLWSLKGRNLANGEWTTLKSADSTTNFDVVFTANYKYYELSAKTYGDGDVMLGDTLNISIVADGKDGASGAMPRYRGEFVFYNESEPYVYNNEYRDIVLYEGNVYQVYQYSLTESVTAPPSIAANADNDGKWQRANKFRFVAMDTALIDSANIGGFMFKRTKYIDNVPVGRLESQYGPVVIRDIDKNSSDIVPVTIKVTSDNGVTSLTTRIVKTEGNYAYALKPTTRLVTLDKDNNPSVSVVSCSLIRKSVSGESSITSVPTGYTLKYSVTGETEAIYTPNTIITVPSTNGATIVFRLRDNQSNIVSEEIIYVFSEESTQSTILYDRYIQFACNDDGSVKFGLPYRFRVSQWQGGKEVPLTNITLSGSYVTIDNERIELDAETGTLKCTNAVVTGEVNATSGNVGGFNLSGNQFLSDFEDLGMRKVVSISPKGVNMNTIIDSRPRSEVEIGTYTGAALRSTSHDSTIAIHAVNDSDGYAFRADGKSAFFGGLIPMEGINFTNRVLTNGSTISSSISFAPSGSVYLPNNDEPFGAEGQVLIIVNYGNTGTVSVYAKTNNTIYSQKYPSGTTTAVSLSAGEMGLFVKRGTSGWHFGRFSS